MRKTSFILLFVMLFATAVRGESQQQGQMLSIPTPSWLEIKSNTLSRDSILVGEQVVWSTIFSMPQERELLFAPYSQVAQSEGGAIDVVHDIKLDTLAIKNGMKELEAKLLLTSFDSGYYKLPLLVAVTKEGDTIYIDSPFLDVTNTPVDTATFVMHPIKGQMRYPITFKEILPWLALALFVAGLVYLLYRYIKYRRENRDFFGKPVVQDPPHIVALRELEKLRGQKLWQSGKEKAFYTGVTDTLRGYIEGRYGVSAMEKTSSEIMESLTNMDIEERYYKELDELFKTADLVKFAKYAPSVEENEEAIPAAVRFVNSTFMQELEEDKQKEEEK